MKTFGKLGKVGMALVVSMSTTFVSVGFVAIIIDAQKTGDYRPLFVVGMAVVIVIGLLMMVFDEGAK